MVENMPSQEIERLTKTSQGNMSIINFDLKNDDNIPGEDCIYKIIKHHFVLNVFLAIFTSFSFPKFPNILEINNKSCVQFVKITKLSFRNLKHTVLENPYNTIKLCISKEVMQYKLYLNTKKYNNYTKYTDIIKPLVEFNNKSNSVNKVFLEHCLNLPAHTFYCFYQILKMFLFYAKPIFYHTLKTPRFAFSKKRAKQNAAPIPNVYQLPLQIFNNLLKFFPQTLHFNFNKVFNVTPLKKERFSTDFCYYTIFQIDNCLLHMNIADRVFAINQIEFCSNKLSVFDHLFDKFKHKIKNTRSNITFYGDSTFVNIYSKRYMLNDFRYKFTQNKLNSVTLKEYLMLTKCLTNRQTLNEIQFKIFLDNFKQIHLNILSKKYVNNLKTFVKPMSKLDFIIKFNLKVKQQTNDKDYLEIEKSKTKYINNCSKELKCVFNKYKRTICNSKDQIHNTRSISHNINRSHYFKSHQDFMQFNRNKLKQLCISDTKLELECKLQLNKAKKICNASWMSFAKLLYKYTCNTNLSRYLKSNYIKIHILENAYLHLNCCLNDKQFDFIYTHTRMLDIHWIKCVKWIDNTIKTISD